MGYKKVQKLSDMAKKPLVRLLEKHQETDLPAKKTDGIINRGQNLLAYLHKNHEKSQADIKCVDEKASVAEAKFDALTLNEDIATAVKKRAIESVSSHDAVSNTAMSEIMSFNVDIQEILPVLSDLSLAQLVDNYAQVDQQSQLLKGLILLEARKRFTSNNDFGKWVESVGTLCSDTRQARTKYMNFASYFKDKS